jgi:hypothetical protein
LASRLEARQDQVEALSERARWLLNSADANIDADKVVTGYNRVVYAQNILAEKMGEVSLFRTSLESKLDEDSGSIPKGIRELRAAGSETGIMKALEAVGFVFFLGLQLLEDAELGADILRCRFGASGSTFFTSGCGTICLVARMQTVGRARQRNRNSGSWIEGGAWPRGSRLEGTNGPFLRDNAKGSGFYNSHPKHEAAHGSAPASAQLSPANGAATVGIVPVCTRILLRQEPKLSSVVRSSGWQRRKRGDRRRVQAAATAVEFISDRYSE